MKSMLFGLALLATLSGCCGWCEKKSCDKPCKKEKVCKKSCEGGNAARKENSKK
jgi:hypothetical protein